MLVNHTACFNHIGKVDIAGLTTLLNGCSTLPLTETP